VCRAADPDPDSFRNRWNAAVQAGDRQALVRLAGGPAVRERPPAELPWLAKELSGAGAAPEAVALLREAQRRYPDDFWINFDLAYQLSREKEPAWDDVIRFYTAAAALRPRSAAVHNNLGNALADKGRTDEAVAEFRKALDLQPGDADAHYNLGIVLAAQNRLDEAIAEYRKALDLHPDDADAHFGLGNALKARGKHEEAEKEYRTALGLHREDPAVHFGLGLTLKAQGRFAEALAALRRGQELGSKQPGRWDASARWVSETEQLLQHDLLLPAVLRGEAEPADAAELVWFAQLCQMYKRRYAASARFWEKAFADRPALKDDLALGGRYLAACAAAMAGCGQGEDAAGLTDADRTRLRRQALDWLGEDLAARRQQLAGPDAVGRAAAQGALRRWRENAGLAGVRDADALDRLPADERAEWRRLWADVDALLQKASPK
jgi:tetratricopeptide (TPR) repeat protein